MRLGKPWVMVAVGLLGCVSFRVVDSDVDAQGAASEETPAEDPPCCDEDDASEQLSSSGIDAAALGSLGSLFQPRDAGTTKPFALDFDAAGCTYLDEYFANGVNFRSNDGCSTCQCFAGTPTCGLVLCTRRPAACDLPFDPGSCTESHTYYAYNSSTGACEAKTYSGCGGNLNRFQDYETCAYRCILSLEPRKDCTYEGVTYQHRQRIARTPSELAGCGPCLCNDGQILCLSPDCQ